VCDPDGRRIMAIEIFRGTSSARLFFATSRRSSEPGTHREVS
jgi:hypothetical protein